MSYAVEMSALFDDRKYADLMVYCGEPTSWKILYCHRAIVCPQSTFFAEACAADEAKVNSVRSTSRRFTAVVDGLHDAFLVGRILHSLYMQTRDTFEWLNARPWTKLLPIFEIARLFRLTELVAAVHERISEEISSIEDFYGIINALDILETHKLKHAGDTSFDGVIAQLQRALTAEKRDQMRTLGLLRIPGRRHEISEASYRKFLDAVKCSDWAQQMQACDDEADSDVDDGWQRSSD